MKYSGITWIYLIFMLAACDSGSQRHVNRDALQEEIRNREPKKISEAQITTEAFSQGQIITGEAQKELLQTLHKVMEESGPVKAAQFCSVQARPIMDSLSQKYNATIRRTSLKPRNPGNAPDEVEKQLLEAYEYNAENNLPMNENVQRLSYDYLLYTKPIIINNELCLRCHGEPGRNFEQETVKAIDQLYPEDKARNYTSGDFRGIWSIKLSQKELVKAL